MCVDDDNDGICDSGETDTSCVGSDNCRITPNGPDEGTCYSWSEMTGSCTSDNDCGGDENSCSMNQEDTYPPGGNGCGDACECEGDFHWNMNVDGSDWIVFQQDYPRTNCTNENPCNGDFDCDGDVDGDDETKFMEDFGRSPFFNPCPNCVTIPWCMYPEYTIDFLESEPLNPGGWNTSSKTFDDVWTSNQGETIDMDIWLKDLPGPLSTGGYFITYDPALVNIINVMPYDIVFLFLLKNIRVAKHSLLQCNDDY